MDEKQQARPCDALFPGKDNALTGCAGVSPDCRKCGWNPAVMEERKKKLRSGAGRKAKNGGTTAENGGKRARHEPGV